MADEHSTEEDGRERGAQNLKPFSKRRVGEFRRAA